MAGKSKTNAKARERKRASASFNFGANVRPKRGGGAYFKARYSGGAGGS